MSRGRQHVEQGAPLRRDGMAKPRDHRIVERLPSRDPLTAGFRGEPVHGFGHVRGILVARYTGEIVAGDDPSAIGIRLKLVTALAPIVLTGKHAGQGAPQAGISPEDYGAADVVDDLVVGSGEYRPRSAEREADHAVAFRNHIRPAVQVVDGCADGRQSDAGVHAEPAPLGELRYEHAGPRRSERFREAHELGVEATHQRDPSDGDPGGEPSGGSPGSHERGRYLFPLTLDGHPGALDIRRSVFPAP